MSQCKQFHPQALCSINMYEYVCVEILTFYLRAKSVYCLIRCWFACSLSFVRSVCVCLSVCIIHILCIFSFDYNNKIESVVGANVENNVRNAIDLWLYTTFKSQSSLSSSSVSVGLWQCVYCQCKRESIEEVYELKQRQNISTKKKWKKNYIEKYQKKNGREKKTEQQ